MEAIIAYRLGDTAAFVGAPGTSTPMLTTNIPSPISSPTMEDAHLLQRPFPGSSLFSRKQLLN